MFTTSNFKNGHGPPVLPLIASTTSLDTTSYLFYRVNGVTRMMANILVGFWSTKKTGPILAPSCPLLALPASLSIASSIPKPNRNRSQKNVDSFRPNFPPQTNYFCFVFWPASARPDVWGDTTKWSAPIFSCVLYVPPVSPLCFIRSLSC